MSRPNRLSCFVLVLTATLRLAAGEPGPPGPDTDDAKTLTSKIAAVTVYADRARVTREAAADLAPGMARVAFRALPGWIDEGSVRVSLTPPDAGQILDVEVRKTFLARSGEEDVRKAEAAVREISDQIGSLDDERHVLDAKAKHVDAIRVFSLEKLPKDAAVRDIKVESYGEVVAFIEKSLREIAKAKRELDLKRRDLQPELAARQRKLNELHARAQLEQRSVLVSLKTAAARNATVSLTYQLPGASWEPVHELRANGEMKSIGLASYAVVTQTTGEDWNSAVLSLSSQGATDTMKLPELEALLVGSGRSVARLVRQNGSNAPDTYQLADISRKQQFMAWNLACNPQEMQQEIQSNDARNVIQQKASQVVFQRIQERGTTAHFQAQAPQTIRTDGRPVRVPIGHSDLTAQHRIVAAPEVSLNAARTVDLANTGSQPLLPGKVSLYLEGAFLGTTETDFVAQGESFALFLGVADRVKLGREIDSKRSAFVSDGKRTRIQVAFEVKAENLSERAVAIQLSDRVPVSESEEVRVRNVKVLPSGLPDEKGLVRWDLALAPKETKTFHLEYTIEYPTDLLARAQQKEGQSGQGQGQGLYRQIDALEKQLKK